MKKIIAVILTIGVIAVLSAPAMADSPNWDQTKIDQVEKNRNTNCGVGNGGEDKVVDGYRSVPTEDG